MNKGTSPLPEAKLPLFMDIESSKEELFLRFAKMQQTIDSIGVPIESRDDKIFTIAKTESDLPMLQTSSSKPIPTNSEWEKPIVKTLANDVASDNFCGSIYPSARSINDCHSGQTQNHSHNDSNESTSYLLEKIKHLELQLFSSENTVNEQAQLIDMANARIHELEEKCDITNEIQLCKANYENVKSRLQAANQKIFSMESLKHSCRPTSGGRRNADDAWDFRCEISEGSNFDIRATDDNDELVQLRIANMKILFLERKLFLLESQGEGKDYGALEMKLAETLGLLEKAKAESVAMEEGFKHFFEDALEASKNSDKEARQLRIELENLRKQERQANVTFDIVADEDLPKIYKEPEEDEDLRKIYEEPQEEYPDAKINTDLQSTQQALQKHKGKAEELQVGLEKAEVDVIPNRDESRDEAAENLKRELEESEFELDKFRTVLQITQEALESAEHELSKLRNELSKAKSKNAETENILNALLNSSGMTELSDLPRELTVLLQKLGFASLNDANSFLEKRDSHVACSLHNLTQSFLELEANLAKTKSELKEARNEASQLTHCLTVTSELSANEYQNLSALYNQLVQDKEEIQRNLIPTEKIAELQRQLKTTKEAKKFAEEAIEHRDAKISVLCDEIEQLSNSTAESRHVERQVA